jgi:hypothetical protein
MKARLLALALLAACDDAATGPRIQAGADDGDAGALEDSLAAPFDPVAGSFDDLHVRILAPRCAGQPGLCHNGQFEPNLTTPALAYAELVRRPSLEKRALLRVSPGDAAHSVLIDKLRNREVSTQMPLGARPLDEADIAALEAWIAGGALRAPGSAPPAALDLPPRAPELGVFVEGAPLAASAVVAVGTVVVVRHSVQDFEVSDADIPFSAITLQLSTGEKVVLSPAGDSPELGNTSHDAAAPMGTSDLLDRQFTWTVPAELELLDTTGARVTRPASGARLSVIAIYTDRADLGKVPAELGYIRFGVLGNAFAIE